MPIVSTDIQLPLSGGATNTTPNASLGGVLSTSAQIVDATANNLFDNVTSAEATAGSTEYRGFYVKNNHATLALTDARIYISQATTSPDDEIDIGIAVEGVSTTMATIANETTAPTSVTFSRPSTFAAGLQLNSTTGLAAAAYRGVWIRRTVNAAAAAATGDQGTIKVEGTTT